MPSTIIDMPIMAAPQTAGYAFLIGTIAILVGLMIWWLASGEFRKRGWIMPLVFIGTGLSAILIEPIFDNTLLYWYPVENALAVFSAYERTIPWYVPLGYAWFFGGTAYLLQRSFAQGVSRAQIWGLFAIVIFTDWLAVSICEWMDLSAFYGNQPFHSFGSPIWFSFTDATGAFVLAAALHVFLPHLTGLKRLWLLILPTFTYGGTLGSVTAPISLALNSAWSTEATWLAGLGTMALCSTAVYAITQFAARTDQASAVSAASPSSASA
jgi:hypothetical protein